MNGRAASTWTIQSAEWFHGVLPRDEVVRLLQQDGDYLVRLQIASTRKHVVNSHLNVRLLILFWKVRESKNRKTGEAQYVLSVKWQESKHFIIQGEDVNSLLSPLQTHTCIYSNLSAG